MRLTARFLAQILVKLEKDLGQKRALTEFCKYIVERGWSSISKVNKIASAYKIISAGHKNEQSVSITSARQLSTSQKKSLTLLAERISQKKIRLVEHVDPKLIGGVILQGTDWRYNADIKSSLQKLRVYLINS
jgi:ATP synthase F1 delta subunit